MKKLSAGIFFFTLFITKFAYSGGMHSGGTDLYAFDDGAAWFLGKDKTINYCYELDPRFGISKAFADSNIKTSIETWTNYISQAFQEVPWQNNLATKFKLIPNCDKADLKIYLGTESQDVLKEKEKFNNPMAFVHRESYDASTGWGKGFIWFANEGALENGHPNWRKEKVFLSVLLHEFGHVFGVPHVEDTIMDEKLAEYLQSDYLLENNLLAKINWTKTLSSCLRKCDFEYDGFLGIKNEIETAENIFKTLFSRNPKGEIKTMYSSKKGLIVSDSQGQKTFPIVLENFPTNQSHLVPVFKQIYQEKVEGQDLPAYRQQYILHQGQTYRGTLSVDKSKAIRIVVSSNLQSNVFYDGYPSKGPYKIEFIENDDIKTLFTATSDKLN